jgi:hypothetical protein
LFFFFAASYRAFQPLRFYNRAGASIGASGICLASAIHTAFHHSREIRSMLEIYP